LFRLSGTEFNRHEVVLAVKKITSAFVTYNSMHTQWCLVSANRYAYNAKPL